MSKEPETKARKYPGREQISIAALEEKAKDFYAKNPRAAKVDLSRLIKKQGWGVPTRLYEVSSTPVLKAKEDGPKTPLKEFLTVCAVDESEAIGFYCRHHEIKDPGLYNFKADEVTESVAA